MIISLDRLRPRHQDFCDDFMIDLVLGQQVKAYNFSNLDQASVVNGSMGEFPVVVWVDVDECHVYLRQVGDQVLTFIIVNCMDIDPDSATRWNVQRGLRLKRSLSGMDFQPVPRMSVFDWARDSCYPDTVTYQP
jgi:hypothetical protein